MKHSLEHNGHEVKSPSGIPKGALLTICAWCDPDKTIAQLLTNAGYKLSHGVCEKHKAAWLAKMNHTIEHPIASN